MVRGILKYYSYPEYELTMHSNDMNNFYVALTRNKSA